MITQRDPEIFLQGEALENQMDAEQIEQFISERLQARRNKNFAEADRLRKLLAENGVGCRMGHRVRLGDVISKV